MEAVLDFSKPVDVDLLDRIVAAMNSPSDPNRAAADKVLNAFREHPDAWVRVDTILERSSSQYTKYYALQILERVVKYRWRSLAPDKRQGIKTYLVSKIVALSSDDASAAREKLFVDKMNLLLVGVLKHEWPAGWPGFIPEIVGASKSSEVLCENNVRILRLLSEEVFDFSKGAITAAKADALKGALTREVEHVFHLCEFILQASRRPSLVNETLLTLQRFVTWIPDRFIFESSLLPTLCSKFLPLPPFRVNALMVLTEVGSLSRPGYAPVFVKLYEAVMAQLVRVVPSHVSIPDAYARGGPPEQLFIRHLALFMSGFLKAHAGLLESPESLALLMSGMDYLVKISEIDDAEVFKICLDYWQVVANDLYSQQTQYQPGAAGADVSGMVGAGGGSGGGGGGGGAAAGAGGAAPPGAPAQPLPPPLAARKALYAELLSRVREVLVKHMAKPEEVLVEVDDATGDVVREATKDTEALAVYKIMKDTLVYLTHLDPEDTEKLLLSKLERQTREDGGGVAAAAAAAAAAAGGGGPPGAPGAPGAGAGGAGGGAPAASFDELNTLCWAIGSISGAMGDAEEKRFLVQVIRDLLGLVEKLRGKNNKAIVASNIMYVVGQYPRFLRAHWKFLRTVVLKLFEFMHERHPGVQDMAVDTFLKVAQKCKKKFVTLQPGEAAPFFDEIVRMIPSIIADLETHQVHQFYEAVGCVVGAAGAVSERHAMVEKLMALVNHVWKAAILDASANFAVLNDPQVVRELARTLRTNVHVCRAVGASFEAQLGGIYLDMLSLYKALSGLVTAAVAASGPAVAQSDAVKAMRAAKREVLALVSAFVTLPDTAPSFVGAHFVPPFLGPVLDDYASAPPAARPPEVLGVLTEIVVKLAGEASVVDVSRRVLDAVFEPTLGMITANFEDFPEHRLAFFRLLDAVNTHAFPALAGLPPRAQALLVEAVVWAFKHTARDVGETGLAILRGLLDNVAAAGPDVAQPFFSKYYLSIADVLLGVLTDRLHQAHFKMHAALLQQLFGLVESGRVTTPLWESPHAVASGAAAAFKAKVAAAAAPGGAPPPGLLSNATFAREYTRGLVTASFPSLKPALVFPFVEGMFDATRDLKAYKTLLRDFLVDVLEMQGDDEGDVGGLGGLFIEEREAAAAAAAAAEAARRAAVPGLINPHAARPGAPADDDDL